MKKTLINILIIFVISSLYSIEKNENIELPKIPLFIEGNYSNFNNPIFTNTYSQNNAFYHLHIEKTKTIKKQFNFVRVLSIAGISVLLGVLGHSIDVANARHIAEGPGGSDEYDEIKSTWTIIGSVVGLVGGITAYATRMEPVSLHEQYTIALFRHNELLRKKKQNTAYNTTLSEMQLNEFLNSVNSNYISKQNKIINLLHEYKKNITIQPFEKEYKKQLEQLNLPRNEFETTLQYQERIVREQIKEKEKLTEYEQKIRITKEKEEIKKFALLQEIKEEIKNIEFTKTYNFEISDYNADKQCYTFNISGNEKKLTVPINGAKKFKENINDYAIQKIFKPTLNGTWEILTDDYVLINTKTAEIIPWEGELPTYVETAVENPPILSASVKLIEPSGEGYLDAEETSMIQVTLTNTGKGSAKMTRISLFQEKGSTLYYDVSNTINEILANQSITSEFKLTVPENIESGNVEFKISFLEEQGFEPSPLIFTAETRAMLKPELILADFGVDDANGDGKISKGETADITIRIQNKGQGKAKKVSLDVVEDRLVNLFIISEKHFELDNIEPGESKDITFTISTNKRVSDVVNVNFNIQEKRPLFSIEDNITLKLEKTQKQLEPIVFVGKDVKTDIIDVTGLSIDIEQDIPQSLKTNENALAIIFGIENYKNVSSVTHATRDANFVKEYLNKTIGIKENNIYFKTNDDVGKAEFDKVFSKEGWLDKRVKKGVTDIYFYYAGHGAPDIKKNKAYLIPYDGDPNYASQTGYEMDRIYSNLADLKAKSVTVFLDACFSGANRESEMLLADARPIFIEVEGPAAHGITVFSATSSKEISSAWPEKKHGLFSYFLMKGLQGDADLNKDKKLSIKELGEYIQQNVSERAGFLDREQTPQMISDDENRILINY